MSDTIKGDIVQISLDPSSAYGTNFIADNEGCAAVIESYLITVI